MKLRVKCEDCQRSSILINKEQMIFLLRQSNGVGKVGARGSLYLTEEFLENLAKDLKKTDPAFAKELLSLII